MDIDDIRRTNIRALEVIAGSPKSAADRVGMTYVQYVNLRDGAKDARSGKPRAMRKETAWRFEDAFGKDRGWLDACHQDAEDRLAAEPATHYRVQRRHARPLVQTLCELAEQVNDNGLRELIGFARCLTGTHPAAKAKPPLSA
jgi:hypothetical protein